MNPLWPSQYPRPEQLIVHLSDTHFTKGRAPMFGLVDSDANLAQALRGLTGAGVSPDAIVITGDIADTAADDAYSRDRLLHTTVPVGDYPTVYEVTREQAEQILAMPADAQAELARKYVTVGAISGPPAL